MGSSPLQGPAAVVKAGLLQLDSAQRRQILRNQDIDSSDPALPVLLLPTVSGGGRRACGGGAQAQGPWGEQGGSRAAQRGGSLGWGGAVVEQLDEEAAKIHTT